VLRPLVLLLAAWPGAGVSAEGARGRPILDTLELPAEVQAVAGSPDGLWAAVALPSGRGERSPRTLLQLHSLDTVEPTTTKISGLVRDLLFSDDNDALYALEHRPAKRSEGEAYLLRIDLHNLKIEDRLRLPPTAQGIEPWRAGRSLLIPARNEIRTITLPLFRSGSLFRILGENLTVSATTGTLVVVGQDAAVLVVDLADPQGREGLPVRDRIATPAPVVSIDLEQGGMHAVAHLADGSDVSLSLDPGTPVETGAAVVREIAPTPNEPEPLAIVEPLRVEAPPPRNPSAPPQVPAPAENKATRVPAAKSDGRPVQAQGTIHDAGADLVISVVFLGPDNLLREAARVRPAADGRWEISLLPAGRYRVQLDAGGARALITEPPFRTLEIGEAPAAALTADFRVVGAL